MYQNEYYWICILLIQNTFKNELFYKIRFFFKLHIQLKFLFCFYNNKAVFMQYHFEKMLS